MILLGKLIYACYFSPVRGAVTNTRNHTRNAISTSAGRGMDEDGRRDNGGAGRRHEETKVEKEERRRKGDRGGTTWGLRVIPQGKR